jgi:hypothetical protein
MRKRFNAEEKAIIANAYKDHGTVEWRNVTTWGYKATISPMILTDEFKSQYVNGINRSSTPTVRYGDSIRIYAGYIRAFDSDKTYR